MLPAEAEHNPQCCLHVDCRRSKVLKNYNDNLGMRRANTEVSGWSSFEAHLKVAGLIAIIIIIVVDFHRSLDPIEPALSPSF